ncbi:hypothetical protein TCON_1647 [Astathelohania contejeani]|uniref:Uncharacterized protein n=1 Tax=Astathelohania contejeani TaxID=164912 RepID=A0ABQ7HY90_9MICR|nr:hypothetical protein TCON_1647 [Thelohania contejeani]
MRCQICHTKNIISLTNKIYCEECEVYYTIKSNQQEYSFLPITHTNKATKLILCSECKKMADYRIKCKNFKEYFRKVAFCNYCKKKNKTEIKTMFFRVFQLYKIEKRNWKNISWMIIFLFVGLLEGIDLFGDIILCLIRLYAFGLWYGGIIITKALISHKLGILDLIIGFIKLYKTIRKRELWYEVPVMLDECVPDLIGCFDKISLGGPGFVPNLVSCNESILFSDKQTEKKIDPKELNKCIKEIDKLKI